MITSNRNEFFKGDIKSLICNKTGLNEMVVYVSELLNFQKVFISKYKNYVGILRQKKTLVISKGFFNTSLTFNTLPINNSGT